MTYNLFELIMPKIEFDKNKPIKLFEAFAGIGTQATALKKLGVEIDHIGISEIDKYALMSYKAIHGKVKNYGDITKIKGGELPEIDIFTYSFPCQDLSKSGRQAGMDKGTRSGLVWEVIRILKEMPIKPKVLLMENVIDLVQAKFVDGFNELQYILSELGYTNWNYIMNALDYNVAQNRNRIFMVSVLGEYAYSFPFKLERTKVLENYLERSVEKKHYISERLLMTFLDTKNRNGLVRALQFRPHDKESNYAFTITTRAGQRPTDNFIIESNVNKNGKKHYSNKSLSIIKKNIVEKSGYANTLTATQQRATIDGATLLFERHETNNDDFVKIPYKTVKMVEQLEQHLISIRRLTPLECWRLMGISDEDFYKAKATGISDTQLYKQAGNAIVVDVLYYIFKNMFKENDND